MVGSPPEELNLQVAIFVVLWQAEAYYQGHPVPNMSHRII